MKAKAKYIFMNHWCVVEREIILPHAKSSVLAFCGLDNPGEPPK